MCIRDRSVVIYNVIKSYSLVYSSQNNSSSSETYEKDQKEAATESRIGCIIRSFSDQHQLQNINHQLLCSACRAADYKRPTPLLPNLVIFCHIYLNILGVWDLSYDFPLVPVRFSNFSEIKYTQFLPYEFITLPDSTGAITHNKSLSARSVIF